MPSQNYSVHLPATRWLLALLLSPLAILYTSMSLSTRVNISHSFSCSAPRIALLNIMYAKMDFGVQGLYQLSAVRNSIYAKLHGYSYVLVEDEEAKGHRDRGCWAKAGNLPSAVKDFDLVVYMDFDVYINNITVPLEQLLDTWGFTAEHDLLMALDPDKPYNHVQLANGTSILNLNAGFIVVRNTPQMISLLEDWYTYKDSGHDDQRAFNMFVRQKVPAAKLLILPCKEANGGDPAWNKEDPTCNGIHIQHAWLDKGYVETRIRNHLLEDMLLTLPIERRRGNSSW